MAKIKRGSYRSIYSSKHKRRGSGAAKWIIGIVAVAALIFLGYSIAGPLMKLFGGGHSTSSASAPSGSSSAPASATASKTPSKPTTAGIRGVYLPKSYLSDTAALNNFITQAKAAGINLAVIDLKAEDGIINYDTSLPMAKGTAMVAPNAPDASVAAKALEAAGITPAARICAFEDPVAPTVLRGAGVMYSGDHSINWLDPQNTRWLNPNSPEAQQYIEGLATEAVSLGYKQVFIDGLTFPTDGSPDTTGYYGANMPSKEQVIASFVTALQGKVDAAGGKLTVMSTGAAAVGQAQANVGQSQDVFSLSGDYFAPNLCPSLLPEGIKVGDTTIDKPDLAPGSTVSDIAQYLKTQDGGKLAEAVPFIQDYTDTALGYGNYHSYTSSDVKSELSALTSAGIGGYVLYNPQGQYDFSSLK